MIMYFSYVCHIWFFSDGRFISMWLMICRQHQEEAKQVSTVKYCEKTVLYYMGRRIFKRIKRISFEFFEMR